MNKHYCFKLQIWVDADACPSVIKEIIFRAVDRTNTTATFVSNHGIYLPSSPFIKRLIVEGGFDVADRKIIECMQPGDLVITADIPLASAAISKHGVALNPRGELYTENNIGQKLSLRNFGEELRNSGVRTNGPEKISKKEIQIFANNLDRILSSRGKPG